MYLFVSVCSLFLSTWRQTLHNVFFTLEFFLLFLTGRSRDENVAGLVKEQMWYTYGTIKVVVREKNVGSLGRNADTQPKVWIGWCGRNQDTGDITGLKIWAGWQLSVHASWKGMRCFDVYSLWPGTGSSSFSPSRVKEGRDCLLNYPWMSKAFLP